MVKGLDQIISINKSSEFFDPIRQNGLEYEKTHLFVKKARYTKTITHKVIITKSSVYDVS